MRISHFLGWLTSSSSEEEIDPRDVATFNGGTSKGVAAARDLDYEITSSNLAISIEFWIKGSNLSKLAETPLTVTDATRAQWVFSWVG
ncbi:MAG TPA: hypothetical protein VD927_06600, partial [Chryseosolibacter sp.]|nr:hypothetical protein [Chryseosolibacter sp.]